MRSEGKPDISILEKNWAVVTQQLTFVSRVIHFSYKGCWETTDVNLAVCDVSSPTGENGVVRKGYKGLKKITIRENMGGSEWLGLNGLGKGYNPLKNHNLRKYDWDHCKTTHLPSGPKYCGEQYFISMCVQGFENKCYRRRPFQLCQLWYK